MLERGDVAPNQNTYDVPPAFLRTFVAGCFAMLKNCFDCGTSA
jgi:hypothetical protein